jgi:hypothetical protein
MVVVEYAKSGRSGCRTCDKNISEGSIRYGTAKSTGEGYFNMEWHHGYCFWKTRARKYFYRGKKQMNTLLRYGQFTGSGTLTPVEQVDLTNKIFAANQKWGTPEALRKAGIPVLENKTAAEKKEDGKTKKRARDSDEEEYSNESKTEEDRVIEQQGVAESKDVVKEEQSAAKKTVKKRRKN